MDSSIREIKSQESRYLTETQDSDASAFLLHMNWWVSYGDVKYRISKEVFRVFIKGGSDDITRWCELVFVFCE
ncbi:hypothetical protein HPP92_006232 [Vanilla planifolia]|uniref:Uncharacterized protein n=1 Tax=Vanilla planifolia TaxID=51239 RepID=A0A835RR55_VANPL|nr:hypothetical protein HPP92_006232 [Vanilla planifolia]